MENKRVIMNSRRGISRRDVLALSAGCVLAPPTPPAAASIGHRGVWWHFPSLLEPGAGPWGGFEIYAKDQVSAWKRILDWLKANDLNLLVTQFPPHFKDRVVMGWGYHYVLDFDEFPEASVFSPGFVRRNRDKVNRILDHAGKLGIPVYIHDYNYISTKNFVERHDALLRKWTINTRRGTRSYLSVPDRLRYLRGNVCWREKVFQKFMVACWKETFAKMPGLAGILATPGEANRCYCPECARGAKDDSTEELNRASRANVWETTTDFSDQFSRTLKELDKQPVLRAWYAAGLEDKLSREVPKAIKYTMFDCFWGGPDPQIRRWRETGHQVWVTKDIYGENAGPIIWNHARYFREVLNTSRSLGVNHLLAHQNPDFGFSSMPLKVQQLNLLCFCHYLRDPGCQRDDWIDAEYERIFGPVGRKIRAGVEAYSEVVLNMARVYHDTREGFTFSRYRPTFQEMGKYEAADWVRGGIGSLKQYIDYLEQKGWSDDLFDVLGKNEGDVFRHMERCIASAKKGIAILGECASEVRDEDRGEFEALVASARLSLRMMTVMDLRYKARVHYVGALKASPRDTQMKLARLAVRELERAAQQFERFRENIVEMPHDHVDFWRTLQLPKHDEELEGLGHGIDSEPMYSEMKTVRSELAGLGLL